VVVGGIHPSSNGRLRFQSDEVGCDDLRSIRSAALRDGEQGRDKDGRCMGCGTVEIIVVVEGVCGGPIDQRSYRGRRAVTANYGCSPGLCNLILKGISD